MNDLRAIVRRIGGQHALTWPSFWVVFALNAVVYFASNLVAVGSGVGWRLVIMSASQLAMYLVPFVAWMFWVRRSAQPRPLLMLMAFLIGGAMRGVVIALAPVWIVGGYQPTMGEIVFRMSASIAIMPITLAVAAIINDLTAENAERSAELARYQRDADAIDHLVFERMQASQADVLARIRGQLERLLRFQNVDDMVAELRVGVDDVVRPLSHTLAASIPTVERPAAQLTRPRIPWSELLAEVGRMPLFMPTLAALLVLVMGGPWMLAKSMHRIDPVLLFSVLAGSWLLLTVCNWLWLRFRLRRSGAVFAVATLMIAVVSLAWWPVFRVVGGIDLDGMVVVSVAYYLTTTWFFVLPRAADRLTRAHSAAVDEAIARLNWEMARAQAAAWQQQRNFAYALHGPLQSAMTAIIFRLEAARVDGALSAELRAEIEHELMGRLESLATSSEEVAPLTTVIDDIRRLWSGIVEFAWEAEVSALEAAEADTTANTVLVDVTREACSNAVRHGRAKTLSIQLRWASAQVLELVIRNDGQELSASASAGLGTQLLNEATVGWSRNRQGGHTVLTALVPVASAEAALER